MKCSSRPKWILALLVLAMIACVGGAPIDASRLLFNGVGFPISPGFAKSVAFDGTNYLAGISSSANGLISAQLFTQDGTLVGSSINLDGTGSAPLVSFDGTNYFVAWADTSNPPTDIFGQFLTPAGTKIGAPLLLFADADANDIGGIAFDGSNFFVAWEANARNSNLISSIQGQFISPSGTLIGSPIQISIDPENQKYPALVFDGTNYLVTWVAQASGTNLWDVRGRLVSKEGTLLNSFVISETPAASAYPVAVASDKTNSLVVWSREVGPFRYDGVTNQWFPMVHGRLVSRSGSFPGPEFQISRARLGQTAPSVACDGNSYLISWRDARLGNCCKMAYLQRLTLSGEPIGTEVSYLQYFWYGPADNPHGLCFAAGKYLFLYPRNVVHGLILSEDSVVQPVLRNLVRTNGQTRLELIGEPSRRYLVEVSSNLTHWDSFRMYGFPFETYPGTVSIPSGAPPDLSLFRAIYPKNACISNLRRIEWAKYQWALDQDKATFNSSPSDSDLFGPGKYVPEKPECPSGGVYYLNQVGGRASCYVSGHTL